MTVYVDDMYKYPMGQFGRMKMSHMVADTVEELLEMADKIGVARKWIQHAEKGKGWVHFDISISARRRAIAAGAKQITLRELALMTMEWKKDTVAARVENGTRKSALEAYSPNYARAHGDLLRRALAYCHDDGKISAVPDLEPVGAEVVRERVVTDEEWARILADLDRREA